MVWAAQRLSMKVLIATSNTILCITICGVAAAARVLDAHSQTHFEIDADSRVIYLEHNTSPRFELATHPSFQNYALRITQSGLCDNTVQQYSGYLDISDTRHLFFWFFEARNSPKDAPLMLWLNGGPGGSSIASGLLFENGPCSVSPDGNGTIRNDFSWNEKVNIIYLDEPIGTGFSYASDGSSVSTLVDLAADVYAFLQVFMHRFPQYASLPLHIAAESWGGHYGPHIGSLVFEKNVQMEYSPFSGQIKINLASIMLANGLTEPASQFETIPEYICGGAPYPPHNASDAQCVSLRLSNPSCLRAIQGCYRYPHSKVVCDSAFAYCWYGQLGVALTGIEQNPYDLSKPCDRESDLCYAGIDYIGTWLNKTETKVALGVDPDFNFVVVNTTVNRAFYREGQAMLNSASLLPELVNHGIRLLAYAGDTDGLCNYMGVELWMSRLQHVFHNEFGRAPNVPWISDTAPGYLAGTVRSAGLGAGNVTFVRIFEAGHMAPHDKPEATLDMISRWVDNIPLA